MPIHTYAKVLQIPGVVTEVGNAIPSSDGPAVWHHCGAAVQEGWLFDGYAFTPPAESKHEVE